ncbi:hypothetical protein HFV00_11175, partial [Acidithiobacillus sp. VAN18-4]|nr:hypothetical protein [Acidithiobacillus sp. VAN18-4]
MKRREFLQSLGVGASVTAFLGSTVARAALLPANHRSGSIEDVEHIVVFMQENRSFDHYFGHLCSSKLVMSAFGTLEMSAWKSREARTNDA